MPTPLVSVRVVTYKHEKYIAQCLEGLLMQRATFPFEVVVGEDCSPDRTREIVMAYQAKYPDVLRVITSETNVGGMKNAMRVQQACQGKYHAFCEGDDYWIDPLKLQKQVDFMEAHQEVSLCFHNLVIMNETKTYGRLCYDTPFPETMDFEQINANCQIIAPMVSIMARNEVLNTLPAWRANIRFSDVLLWQWCAHHGRFGYLNEVMSVYRRHTGSMTSAIKPDNAGRLAEVVSIYQRFDAETQYAHTETLQARIRCAEVLHQRTRMGWVYFVLHPAYLIRRMRKYLNLIIAEQRIW